MATNPSDIAVAAAVQSSQPIAAGLALQATPAAVGRRTAITSAAALTIGIGALRAESGHASDDSLVSLCAEFHRLEPLYEAANLVWDQCPESDPAGAAEAEQHCDLLSDLQEKVILAIGRRRCRTRSGAQAKARVIASYFDIDSPEDCASQLMLWSLVRDVAAGGLA